MSPTTKERKAVCAVIGAIADQGIRGETGEIMSLAACMLSYVLGKDVTPETTADWIIAIIQPEKEPLH